MRDGQRHERTWRPVTGEGGKGGEEAGGVAGGKEERKGRKEVLESADAVRIVANLQVSGKW